MLVIQILSAYANIPVSGNYKHKFLWAQLLKKIYFRDLPTFSDFLLGYLRLCTTKRKKGAVIDAHQVF